MIALYHFHLKLHCFNGAKKFGNWNANSANSSEIGAEVLAILGTLGAS
jgi:hypothetical protein